MKTVFSFFAVNNKIPLLFKVGFSIRGKSLFIRNLRTYVIKGNPVGQGERAQYISAESITRLNSLAKRELRDRYR